MLKAKLNKHSLIFAVAGGTSRGVLTSKISWYVTVWDDENPNIKGIGECSIIPGLSPDDSPELIDNLNWLCTNINVAADNYQVLLKNQPAIRFAVEMALSDLQNGGGQILFPSDFTKGLAGIPINGLIWMGEIDEMSRRIEEKLADGFTCIKIKIGALNFNDEYSLLKELRNRFSLNDLELRVDANGAFLPGTAPIILDKLAKLEIHSIEQPIKAGMWKEMAEICANSPIPVALDEELIGIYDEQTRSQMLSFIKPQYIILKPSILGGFNSSQKWINIADSFNIGWWVTSALEGNVGLNAIAQWTATLNNKMHQGLGTGQVFTNNILSPLKISKGELLYIYSDSLKDVYFRIP